MDCFSSLRINCASVGTIARAFRFVHSDKEDRGACNG